MTALESLKARLTAAIEAQRKRNDGRRCLMVERLVREYAAAAYGGDVLWATRLPGGEK